MCAFLCYYKAKAYLAFSITKKCQMGKAKISKPGPDEYAPHYATYIQRVDGIDLVAELERGRDQFLTFLRSIPQDKLDYRYQADKWSTKEVLVHMMDVERIFSYRALRFSRNDSTALSGFDDDAYVAGSNASARSLPDITAECSAIRASTIEFFRNITEEMSRRSGIANGKEMSVRAIGYTIVGHELHHMDVIRQKYLGVSI
jgi:uncharacterized damage-inducible protein DinB